MSTNDDRKNTPVEDADHALGTGAHGSVDNPAEGLDAATVVKPVGSEPVDGVGVAGDTPAPAPEAEPVSAPTEGEK